MTQNPQTPDLTITHVIALTCIRFRCFAVYRVGNPVRNLYSQCATKLMSTRLAQPKPRRELSLLSTVHLQYRFPNQNIKLSLLKPIRWHHDCHLKTQWIAGFIELVAPALKARGVSTSAINYLRKPSITSHAIKISCQIVPAGFGTKQAASSKDLGVPYPQTLPVYSPFGRDIFSLFWWNLIKRSTKRKTDF